MQEKNRNLAYSVIIPTFNRPGVLKRCLETINHVRTPSQDWEVLVIDNSSDENLCRDNSNITNSFHPSHFNYIKMEPLGLMAARHMGVEIARGWVISFIDDDSFLSETWLEGIEQAFADPGNVLASGPIRPEYETQPPSWLSYLWTTNEMGHMMGYLSLVDFGNSQRRMSPLNVWGCNYSIRKDIFLKVKGSHPDYLPSKWKQYQGDGEVGLSVKIQGLGQDALYSPLCEIRHWVPTKRMCLEYLKERSFFNGLHESFTAFRRENGLSLKEGVIPLENPPSIVPKQLRLILHLLKSIVWPSKHIEEPEDVKRIKSCLQASYLAGWNYHRKELKSDLDLQAYVLRPHYMGENAAIPLKTKAR